MLLLLVILIKMDVMIWLSHIQLILLQYFTNSLQGGVLVTLA
jgi:hypothetical protein